MKHIKQYKSIKSPSPKIGDYAIITPEIIHEIPLSFFQNNIGQIDHIFDASKYFDEITYKIRYDNLNAPHRDNSWFCQIEEILYFSPIKSDVETYLTANKYNL